MLGFDRPIDSLAATTKGAGPAAIDPLTRQTFELFAMHLFFFLCSPPSILLHHPGVWSSAGLQKKRTEMPP